MDLYAALGKRIRILRKMNHLTQEALAAKANISLSFLGHIERGTRKLSVDTLYKVAEALDCSVDILLDTPKQNQEIKYSMILHMIADAYEQMGK